MGYLAPRFDPRVSSISFALSASGLQKARGPAQDGTEVPGRKPFFEERGEHLDHGAGLITEGATPIEMIAAALPKQIQQFPQASGLASRIGEEVGDD
jgi:hypothetical protein